MQKTIDDLISGLNNDIQKHDGRISFIGIEGKKLFFQVSGRCSSCFSNREDLIPRIESILSGTRWEGYEIKIESAISDEMLDFARYILNKK